MPVIARINCNRSPLLTGAQAYQRDTDSFVSASPSIYESVEVAAAEIERRGLVDVSIWEDEFLESFENPGEE